MKNHLILLLYIPLNSSFFCRNICEHANIDFKDGTWIDFFLFFSIIKKHLEKKSLFGLTLELRRALNLSRTSYKDAF